MREMHSQLSSLLTIFIQVAIGISAPPQRNNQRGNNPAVCQTENCKETSAFILSGLNPEEDPCDDFYEFTCGRWRKTNPLPQGQEQWSKSSVTKREATRRLIDILEAPNGMNVSRPVALMRKYYRDCMDLDTRNRISIEPIDRILRRLSDWPLLGSNTAATISWQELDRHYSELLGTYSFFHITGDVKASDYSTYEIGIDSAEFPKTRDFPLDDRWEDEEPDRSYVEYFLEVVKNFYRHRKIPYSEEKLMEDIAEILFFEFSLHQATKIEEFRKETIKELQISYDTSLRANHNGTANINWLKSIADIFQFVDIQINENHVINVMARKYILQLGRLLNSTPNRVIVNYIHWKFVAETISFTDDRMRKLPRDVDEHVQSRPSRQRECLKDCKFRPVLFYEYAKKYFTSGAKRKTYRMARRVQRKALEELERVEWLDGATKSTLMKKIQGMHMLIGYPRWYNDQNFTQYYKNLEPRASYAEEMINTIKFFNLINLSQFRKPVDKYEWLSEPINTSSSYYYFFNKIVFPITRIQAHDCCNDLPRAVQYGFDGFIIGHELFHGLGPTGMGYNENGEPLSLPRRTERRYNEKVKCIVDEYSGNMFIDTDPQTGVPIWIRTSGELSKGEDVADIGGIRVAFETYREEAHGNDLKLPGLGNYSSDQLFFISYASAWCKTATTDWWKKTFQSSHYNGGHSPGRMRVNNPLKNFNEFAKAFNCNPGDKMIWRSKCTIFN